MHPMTQKSLKLTKEVRKYWKMFGDKCTFGDGSFYLKTYHPDACISYKTWPSIKCIDSILDVAHIGGQVQVDF
jgi:hypothetical protein